MPYDELDVIVNGFTSRPLEVAFAEGIAGADDEAAVLADDEGVNMVAVLLQGQGVRDVGNTLTKSSRKS